MKQARAIFLGGELLDASEVKDYSEYYNKGFICPFCLEKVFYQQEFTRQISDKTVPISPMFKHHKGDPLNCEARSQSANGLKVLAIMSGESRSQRKQIWIKYLWEIFKKGNKRNGMGFDPPASSYLLLPIHKSLPSNTDFEKIMNAIGDLFYGAVFSGKFHGLKYYDEVSTLIADLIKQDGLMTSYKIKTDPAIHSAICMEIIKTLSDPLLERVGQRIIICCIAGGRFPKEFVKKDGPLHQLEKMIRIREMEKQSGFPKGGSESNKQLLREVFNLFFPYFIELIVSVDWLELSKEPWPLLVISKRGKGFAKSS